MSESKVVILGSGIIGLSTAFYLSQSGKTKPEDIHLVDPIEGLFHCASGYAGGFLAADWFAPSVAPLGSLSFKLHKHLADTYNGRKLWGYSTSTGMSYSQDAEQDAEEAVGGSGEDWLSNGTSRAQAAAATEVKAGAAGAEGPVWLKRVEGGSLEIISRDDSTAQLDPWKFCRFLLEECRKRGVQMHQPAKAISVLKDGDNQLNGVRILQDGKEIDLPCTHLLLTAGAWTPRVFSTLFPTSSTRIPIASLAGHSLLIKNPFFKHESHNDTPEETCHAVFATDNLGFSPEWFSRAGGEVYLAGLNTTQIPLPENASDAKPREEAVQQMKECARVMMGVVEGRDVEVKREALCFRPVTGSGRPIISRIQDSKLGTGLTTKGGAEGGVFVAAGHGAWGITQGPGTGLCITELVEGRKTSADLTALALP